jgi:hypothetical protein
VKASQDTPRAPARARAVSQLGDLTQRPARANPGRPVRIAVGPSEDNPYFIITIRVGPTWDDYCVKPLPAEFGAAYEVEKMFNPDAAVYHVRLSEDGAMTCECKGRT